MDFLNRIRNAAGPSKTVGLDDDTIKKFLVADTNLGRAIAEAWETHKSLDGDETYKLSETDLIQQIYAHWCHFYPRDTRNPYVPLAARGPWIVTLHGAVVHDNGGYGMLGFGHNPDFLLAVLSKPQCMANIMTPNLSHKDLIVALREEIGHTRESRGCPYEQFLMMNSGSEGNSVADRIIDVHTSRTRAGRSPVVGISLKHSFHGRTFKPASWSDSSKEKYEECYFLAEMKKTYNRTVEPNDVSQLRRVFEEAETQGVYIEAIFIEAVMGEGNPGSPITVAFYNAARELTLKHDSMLLIDSVQAGFRAHGVLSIVDYPGFQDVQAPDFEVFSKALNGGQYPLSVVALNARAAAFYREGIYGNTMTGSPRACDIATAVLKQMKNWRANVKELGLYAKEKFEELRLKFHPAITAVTGTGLLYAVHLDKHHYPVVAVDGAEYWLRTVGLGVVHGGHNALRFTPCFTIRKAEIDLQVDLVAQFLARSKALSPVLKHIESADQLCEANSPTNKQHTASLELRGHLFDTQFVNDALSVIESHHALAHFENLRLGATNKDVTEMTLQVIGKDLVTIDSLVPLLKSLAHQRNCLVA